jgi:hypothetical protein
MIKGSVVAPTCLTNGYTVYTCAYGCGKTENRDTTPSTGHTYGNPQFTWTATAESATCEATFTCTVCADGTTDKVKTVLCTVNEESRTAATCANDGSVTYTATVTFNGNTHTNDYDPITIPATGEHKDTDSDHKCNDCDAVMDTAVAQIGNIYYGSLSEAVNAVSEGGTITLLTDVNEALSITKPLTIILNGKVISGDVEATGMEIVKTAEQWIIQEKAMLSEIIKPNGKSLLFKDAIQIKFYFLVEGRTESILKDAGIEIWSDEDFDENNLGKPTQVITGLERNGSEYQIVTDGIAAKNMGDMLHVRGYIEVDGVKEYTEFIHYSPAIYCQNKIEAAAKKPNDVKAQALAELCISLMNYGAEAQKYFAKTSDYKYETLMNSFMTEAQQAWSYDESKLIATKELPAYNWTAADESIIKHTGKSVLMTGALQLKQYALISNAYADGDISMLYWRWTAESDGQALDPANAIAMTDIGPNGAEYQGYIKGIAAKNMGDTVYMCASVTKDGTTYYTAPIAYSIHQYAASRISKNTEMADLAKTMVIYSAAAHYYLVELN